MRRTVKYVELSKIFRPMHQRTERERSASSRSQKLLRDLGAVGYAGVGLQTLLPLAVRALGKLTDLVEKEMEDIGAQKIHCPSLAPKELWEKSGRWELMGADMFKFTDRHRKEYCLSPTHEEAVTSILSGIRPFPPAKAFPLLLFQVSEKYRDEVYARFGLLRSRSFLMKDLYSFDVDEEASKKTYALLVNSYRNIFSNKMGLRTYFVEAASGKMGGNLSHEFHLENPTGQDYIYFCDSCDSGINSELGTEEEAVFCPSCQGHTRRIKTVEIGHTFLLGTKYSSAFEGYFMGQDKPRPLEMGCYGIGVTRLLAASVDAASSELGVESSLRWPSSIAPYRVLLIPPKEGSKEDSAAQFVNDLAGFLCEIPGFSGEVVVDDRLDMTVGKRLFQGKQLGFPFIIVGAKTVVEGPVPMLEMIDLNKSEEVRTLNSRDLVAELSDKFRNNN